MFLFLTVHQTRVCVLPPPPPLPTIGHWHCSCLCFLLLFVVVLLHSTCPLHHHSFAFISFSCHSLYIVIMFIMSPRTFAHATQQKRNAFFEVRRRDRQNCSFVMFFFLLHLHGTVVLISFVIPTPARDI